VASSQDLDVAVSISRRGPLTITARGLTGVGRRVVPGAGDGRGVGSGTRGPVHSQLKSTSASFNLLAWLQTLCERVGAAPETLSVPCPFVSDPLPPLRDEYPSDSRGYRIFVHSPHRKPPSPLFSLPILLPVSFLVQPPIRELHQVLLNQKQFLSAGCGCSPLQKSMSVAERSSLYPSVEQSERTGPLDMMTWMLE
jgi:hypothetical protein